MTAPSEHTTPHKGVALICDKDGTVEKLLFDTAALFEKEDPPALFTAITGGADDVKVSNFFCSLRDAGSAFDWQITVPLGTAVSVFHFSGIALHDHYLIVASTSRSALPALYEQILALDERAYAGLSESVSRAIAQLHRRFGQKIEFYEEISRLNNELSSMHREMAKKNVQLQHLNEEKNRFLGMAAHDLRKPLAVISMYTDFLFNNDPGSFNPEQREFLSIIKKSSRSMLGIINDFLDFSKIEAGKLDLRKTSVHPALYLREIIKLHAAIAAAQQITIVLDTNDGLPEIAIDTEKFEQVLNNLLTNAIQYSGPNTHIRVTASSDGSNLRIAVSDQGQGIEESELKKLFFAFHKGASKKVSGEVSTGLGLAIAQKIVKAHGGSITVQSAPGEGSCFVVMLPLGASPAV